MSAARDLPVDEPMANADLPPGYAPLIGRRSLGLLAAVALLWSVLAWFAVERQLDKRIAASVAEQTSDIGQHIVIISANMDRVFNRLQGIGAVLAGGSDVKAALASFGAGATPSSLEYKSRKAAWTGRADLLALNRQLRAAAGDIGVDIIWVMNAGGDCVAASNSEGPASFVGTNYADRDYFGSTKAGNRGHQYAVGRVTKVPGLFFSAPVIAEGRFLGAVAVKADLPKLASAVNHPGAFVTDDQGVIILAADRQLEMRALPEAPVHRLSAWQRQSRYMREEFDTHDMGSREPGGLARIAGSPVPHIAERSELPQHGLAVHVLTPVRDINRLRGDARVTFLLLCFAGLLLIALGFGARAYLLRTRQYRERLEELASLDGLTGIANRRTFDETLAREWARAQRDGRPVSLLMADIDYFKRYNDRNGHPGGDECLRQVANAIAGTVNRSSDLAARYGGEEFAVILPNVDAAAAAGVAEKIRAGVAALALPHGASDTAAFVTVSIGAATLLPSAATRAAGLIAAADRALYQAKHAGRNRVVSATGAEPAHARAQNSAGPDAARRTEETGGLTPVKPAQAPGTTLPV